MKTTNEILNKTNFPPKDNLHQLGHADLIKEGDIVFDDFGNPQFKIGINHPRLGTEYDAFMDMPIYRMKTKMLARDFA